MIWARLRAVALALVAPFVLTGCLATPGKFVSTLDISSDRSFTFTYQGEVIVMDPNAELSDSLKKAGSEEEDTASDPATLIDPASAQESSADEKAEAAAKEAEREAKNRAIAAALLKEAGYRKVEYKGNGLFVIDYAISGRLNHSFIYPYNLDAEIIFPFLAIELRQGDTVRVKAPAFGQNDQPNKVPGAPSDSGAQDRMDGTFTLTTNAEVVSQNNEDGATTLPNGRRSITWRATPLSKDAPTAVLRLQPIGQ